MAAQRQRRDGRSRSVAVVAQRTKSRPCTVRLDASDLGRGRRRLMVDVLSAAFVEPLRDEELAALAVAADPDTPVDDNAVCLWQLTGSGTDDLLPEWYMPSPARGIPRLRGWRRWVTLIIIASFLAIEAYGLCSTYGRVVLA